MGKIYNEDGIKKQYIVEYSGKRGTLVKYTQRRDGETTREEACDCIIRSTPYWIIETLKFLPNYLTKGDHIETTFS